MAWSAAQLSAAVRTAYANDKPILFGENILEATTQSAWRTWQASSGYTDWTAYATTVQNLDATNSSFPLYRVYDRHTRLQSEAQLPSSMSSGNDRWAALFKFPAATFDAIAILNHNFGSLSNFYGYNADPANPDFYVYAVIDNVDSFDDTPKKLFTWKNPSSDKPLLGLNLSHVLNSGDPSSIGLAAGHPYIQYSDVTNAQISLVCATALMGTGTGQPRVGEILFGKRVQLLHQAKVPYNDNNLFAVAQNIDSPSGIFRRYARHSGGVRFDNSYTVTSDRSDIDTWFSDHIDHGIKNFLYIPRPSKAEGGGSVAQTTYDTYSAGESYWVALEADAFSLQRVDGPFESSLQLVMKEIPPYNSGVV